MKRPDFYEITKEMERQHGLEGVQRMWREVAAVECRKRLESRHCFAFIAVVGALLTYVVLI